MNLIKLSSSQGNAERNRVWICCFTKQNKRKKHELARHSVKSVLRKSFYEIVHKMANLLERALKMPNKLKRKPIAPSPNQLRNPIQYYEFFSADVHQNIARKLVLWLHRIPIADRISTFHWCTFEFLCFHFLSGKIINDHIKSNIITMKQAKIKITHREWYSFCSHSQSLLKFQSFFCRLDCRSVGYVDKNCY